MARARTLPRRLPLAGARPAPDWKCTDNAGFNCTCKNVSANTCSSTEIDARKATGATNVKVVSACPQ